MRSTKKKKKNKYSIGIGNLILIFIALIVQVAFIGMLGIINILPFLYIGILVAILALINVGVIIMIRCSKKGSTKRLGSTAITIFIMILMIMGCFYLLNTFDTFNKISSDGRQM
ncbi:MAG: hypothetical protein IKJ85_07040, partial [Firmicutes bacterium]|nr:hypothetical protein [Bacillota bacterium]